MTVSQIRVLCRDKMMHTGEKQSGAGLSAALLSGDRIGSGLMKTTLWKQEEILTS